MTTQLDFLDLGHGAVSTHAILGNVREHYTLLAGIAAGLVGTLVVRYLKSPWRKLPPGPPGLPFIGNALQFKSEQWLQYSSWRKEYGMFNRFVLFRKVFDDLLNVRRRCIPECWQSTHGYPEYSSGCG